MSPLNMLPPRLVKALVGVIAAHFVGGREVIAEIGEALARQVEPTWLEWLLHQTGADPSRLSTGSDFALMAFTSILIAFATLVTSFLDHPVALAAVWYSLHHMKKGQAEFREEFRIFWDDWRERVKAKRPNETDERNDDEAL